MKYKHVYQVDKTGCGIAVMAMLTGRTYKTILRKTLQKKILRCRCNLGTNISDLKKIGAEYGITFGRCKKVKGWRNIPSTSVVMTNFSRDEIESHWILFVRNKAEIYFLDPGSPYKKVKNFRGRKRGIYWEVVKLKQKNNYC